MVSFYLVFLVVTLGLAYPLGRRGLRVLKRWQSNIRLLTIIDALFLLVESLIWLFMLMVTFDAIRVEFSPGTPKPHFLMTWGLGIVLYGLVSLVRMPLEALIDSRVDRADDTVHH